MKYRVQYKIKKDQIVTYSAMWTEANNERQARKNAQAVLAEQEPPPAKIVITSVEVL